MGVDFKSFEEFKLEDLASYGRGREGVTYPAGTSTLQISATRGQIGYLEKPGPVASKDAAITPAAWVNPKYFNYIMQKNIANFMTTHATGLNVKIGELGNLPMELHNSETQSAIVEIMRFYELEVRAVEMEIKFYEQSKKYLLEKMFPEGVRDDY